MSKVIVGISGGVDSSVAAYLLKKNGYDVIGVTFIFTDDFDTKDAVEVCRKLGIEHHILDYKEIFKEKVIDKFVSDYKSGITPNPCIMCNREVKFNFLYENMKKYNCDYIATGHYAKILNGRLYKSSDLNKDQTYFLSQLTKEQLSKLLLPLEGINKAKVREIAHNCELINAYKKDSYDVCFINDKFKNFISDKICVNKGDIINIVNNEIVGQHDGLNNYTIGQRKGLNIGGTTERMYVVDKDVKNKILYIATGDKNDYLISTSCILKNINLFHNKLISKCKVKFRYRQEEIDATLDYINDNEILVKYPCGAKSVTPGQVCAFYKDNECLGGGIIKRVIKNQIEE